MSLRTSTLFAAACLGLFSAVFIVACDGGEPEDAGAPGGDTPAIGATATPRPAEGTGSQPSAPVSTGSGGGSTSPAPPSFPASDEPPLTTASADGQSVEMGLGTYCWTLMCVDKIGVPTRGTLTVSPGDTISVAVPAGAPALREAVANTFTAGAPQILDDGSEIWPYPGSPGDQQAHSIAGDNVEVTVDLPPGRYVLAVGMFFESGDAVYGVLLEVQ
jgi:hypothetical protein